MNYLRTIPFHPLCAVALLFTVGCSRFDMLNATVPTWDYHQTLNQPYGKLPRQKLDVYVPRGASTGRPIVIFFYGGSWQSGEKRDYRFVAEALASKGFIAVLPDYRVYPEVKFPTFVEDGALAIRWTRDHAQQLGGDPNKICLLGHSAGAHIVALLNLDAHYLNAVGLDQNVIRATAALSGPYDFVPRPSDLAVFGMDSTDQTPDPRIEPIHFADGKNPPMLLVQGLRDSIVDPRNAFNLDARIRDAGGKSRLITYPNRGHADIVLSLALPFRWLAPVLRDATAFFNEAVR